MELKGITDKALEVITQCGYGKTGMFRTQEFLGEPLAFYEEEGYNVSSELMDIIGGFYMLTVGRRGTLVNGVFTATKNAFLENNFVVYPENIYDAAELFKKLGSSVGDTIVPLGLLNDDYIALGNSGKVYIISDEVYIGGESWVDFLNNFAENRLYLPETVLE